MPNIEVMVKTPVMANVPIISTILRPDCDTTDFSLAELIVCVCVCVCVCVQFQ